MRWIAGRWGLRIPPSLADGLGVVTSCCNIEGLWSWKMRFGVRGSLTPISFLALVARSQLMPCPVALCNPVAQFCGSPDGLRGCLAHARPSGLTLWYSPAHAWHELIPPPGPPAKKPAQAKEISVVIARQAGARGGLAEGRGVRIPPPIADDRCEVATCCNIEGLWLSELRFGVTGSLTPISLLCEDRGIGCGFEDARRLQGRRDKKAGCKSRAPMFESFVSRID